MSTVVPEFKVHQPSGERIPLYEESQRPPLEHASTVPDMQPYHGQEYGKNNLNSNSARYRSQQVTEREQQEKGYQLLNELSNRQSSNYRYVNFSPTSQDNSQVKSQSFIKQVSFDDMNIGYDDDDDEPDEDDDVGWEIYKAKHAGTMPASRGYSRGRSLSPGAATMSSSMASPRRTSQAYEESDRMDYAELRRLEREIVQYPTRPISTLRCCSITRRHNLYKKLYNGQLYPQEPVLPHRVILVYISARIHTWVALDWVLTKFVENGDKVIVCATIDPSIFDPKKKTRYSRSRSRSSFTDPLDRYRSRSKPENIIELAKNLMKYCMLVINPNKIAKVSIELVAGKTKAVLKDMYRLYEPNLVCTGTKPNLSVGAPLRSWTSSKLTDRLVKNFPLPVIVVPAVNMCNFEYSVQSTINDEPIRETVSQVENVRAIDNEEFEGEDDDETNSIESDDVSTHSDDSVESYSSYEDVARIYKDYHADIKRKLTDLEHQPLNENYFANLAIAISENSLKMCEDIIQVEPNFLGKGAKLARVITGSNKFGHSPYRTKSLLTPNEAPKKEVPKEHGMSFKEVSEQLKLNKIRSQSGSPASPPPVASQQPPPPPPSQEQQQQDTHDHSSPPPQSLKWGGLEKPSKRRNSVPNYNRLSKCLSDDVESKPKNERLSFDSSKLEPHRSHAGFTSRGNEEQDDHSKGKWKKLKNLFKRD
ncbi:uncharacterized protein LODBEIA_P55210 [Lodderomyces beijingensis]|uniref:Uncharacterized protein n=1 Tax=Lodderomyces beijingensis TaxID=1775926 RepID=A0ABP0ZWB9_9ASCO